MNSQEAAHRRNTTQQRDMLNRIIDDDNATIALYTDPNDEIFQMPYV